MSARFLSVLGVVVGAALLRLLPHPWNFAPIGAMALFSGAHFESKRSAFIIPLAALFLSDLFLGFYGSMPVIYGCFLITVLIGMAIKGSASPILIASASLVSSLSFFVFSNLSVWMFEPLYPKNSAGLLACYTAALPFFQHTVVGDLLYTGVLFGAFRLAEHGFPPLRQTSVPVPSRLL